MRSDSALATLPEDERRVIELRFGTGGEPETSLREVARRLGVTQERARKLEARALGRLADDDVAGGLAKRGVSGRLARAVQPRTARRGEIASSARALSRRDPPSIAARLGIQSEPRSGWRGSSSSRGGAAGRLSLGDREWDPKDSTLRILEGPQLSPPELAYGQGLAATPSAPRRTSPRDGFQSEP